MSEEPIFMHFWNYLRSLFVRSPFNPYGTVSHVFVDIDSHVHEDVMRAMAPGLQAQLREDFAPEWGMGFTDIVRVGGASPQPGEIEIQLHAEAPPDLEGALAIHDKKPDGTPIVHAFVALAARSETSLSSCVSHELLEARADWDLVKTAKLPDGRTAALEICDQVEQLSYQKLGTEVSDFNTKANYGAAKKGAKYDFLGRQPNPFQVMDGGYAQTLDPDRGWIQLGPNAHAYHAELARLGLGRGSRRQTAMLAKMFASRKK